MKFFNPFRRRNPVREEIENLQPYITSLKRNENKLELLREKLTRLQNLKDTKQGIELSIPLLKAITNILEEISQESNVQFQRAKEEDIVELKLTEEEHNSIIEDIKTQVKKLEEAEQLLTKFIDEPNNIDLVKTATNLMTEVREMQLNLRLSRTNLKKLQQLLGIPETNWTKGQYGFEGDLTQISDHLIEHIQRLPNGPDYNIEVSVNQARRTIAYLNQTIELLNLLKSELKKYVEIMLK